MKFNKLVIQNFLTAKEIQLDLSNRGLVLVLGKNKDVAKAESNGAGKSLLLDALCWCLWGQTVRDVKNDAVVNRWVKKDCMVSVSFVDNDIEYEVSRYRKHTKNAKENDLRFFSNGQEVTAEAMASTQAHIERVLGIDFDTFQAMMPGAGIKVAELTDAKVKQLLEKVLHFEDISKAQEIAKEESKKLDVEVSNTLRQLQSTDLAIEESEKRISQYRDASALFEKQKQEDLALADLTVSKSTSELNDITFVLAQEKDLKASLEANLETQAAYQQAFNVNVRVLRTVIETHRDTLESLSVDKRSIETDIKKERKLYEECSKHLAVGSCSSCGTTLSVENTGAYLSERLANIERLTAALRAKEALTVETMKEATELLNEEASLTATLQTDLSTLATERNTINAGMQKVATAKQQSAQCAVRLSDAVARRDKIAARENTYDTFLEEEETKYQGLVSSRGTLMVQHKALATKKNKYDFWVDGFSSQGLRSHILKNITPVLNSRATYYSELLTDGEMTVVFNTVRPLSNGKLKEEFNIEVQQAHGGDSYKGSSRGERARSDLVIALSIGDLASMSTDKFVSFRFFDEPFENVDNAGTDAIVRLLSENREKYETVFVITHKDHFKQLFTNTVTVVKHNGVSVLEEEYGSPSGS